MSRRREDNARRTCPLCRRKAANLEYHHWDYEEDIGVRICEYCHEYIHRFKKARDQENWLAKGQRWQHDAYPRAVNRYEDLHGIIKDWEGFWGLLNIPERDWRAKEI
jgi:hypothetical protein